jgi:hemoglobin
MRGALDRLGLDPEAEQTLWSYLERAAQFMINVEEDAPTAGGRRSLGQIG